MAEKESSFFDAEFRLRKIDKIGDPLKELDAFIDWEHFRPILNKAFTSEEPAKGPGGRPPYDYVLRFKLLVLQRLYNLSDDAMEYQINDRRTFQRFIGLDDKDSIPDAKTIWAWREILVRRGSFDKLFDRFWKYLEDAGIEANSGSIVDASFIDKPRQRNSKDENDTIKDGKIPDEWQKPENKAMLRQKDTDARWTKKNDEKHYGYKNHVKVDNKTKLIKKSIITDAAVHDSQALPKLLDKTDKEKPIYADSAYSGKDQIAEIQKRKAIPRVNEKGYRNRPLTEKQKKRNLRLSKTRARVEHVFGTMTMSMGGMFIRCVGIIRAEAEITFMNLVYNIKRYMVLARG